MVRIYDIPDNTFESSEEEEEDEQEGDNEEEKGNSECIFRNVKSGVIYPSSVCSGSRN